MKHYKAITKILILIIAVLIVIIVKQRQDINNFMGDNRRLIMMKNYQMAIIDSMAARLSNRVNSINGDTLVFTHPLDSIFIVSNYGDASLK
jgi:hypothetical protein